jgi:hypothetical protein
VFCGIDASYSQSCHSATARSPRSQGRIRWLASDRGSSNILGATTRSGRFQGWPLRAAGRRIFAWPPASTKPVAWPGSATPGAIDWVCKSAFVDRKAAASDALRETSPQTLKLRDPDRCASSNRLRGAASPAVQEFDWREVWRDPRRFPRAPARSSPRLPAISFLRSCGQCRTT